MIIRTLSEIFGTSRVIKGQNWRSDRLLLAEDKMGFSLHITTITAGSSTQMCYKNHLEAVFCIEGQGFITDLRANKRFQICPGTVYALNEHDSHMLEAETEMRLICVFCPPCVGTEVHDEEGSYPLLS